MINNIIKYSEKVNRVERELTAIDPLLQVACMLRLEKGKQALQDIDSPAFARKLFKLDMPTAELGSQRLNVPAPISRLLNIVLGQDGILFPVEG